MRPGQLEQPCQQAPSYASLLSGEQRMLVVLKRELYDGSWDAMLADLHARLDGRPYVFSLANRIGDDIERIEQLRTFEQAHQVDLADAIGLDS